MGLHEREGQARACPNRSPDVEAPVVGVGAPSTALCPAEPDALPIIPAVTHPAVADPADSPTAAVRATSIAADRTVPCVLMRAGTSRGPFFLRSGCPQTTSRATRR